MNAIVTARITQATATALERENRLADWQASVPRLKIMAHGDSWFDYPTILLTGGGVPDHLSDILGVPILNMAHHGDCTEQMLSVKKRKQLEENLVGKDILLFSGGGNDIAGDQFCLWLNDRPKDNPAGYTASAINWRRLNNVFNSIVANYLDLFDIRDQVAPKCLIVTHSYDYPVPSDKGVCGLGPWLKPSLDYCGWTDPAEAFAIVKAVMVEFNSRMQSLAEEQTENGRPHLHVNTQGILEAGDWSNEIHPNREGFQKVATAIYTAMKAQAMLPLTTD